MDLFAIIAQKRAHLQRLANTNGALGERGAVLAMKTWLPRPRRNELKLLLDLLAETGVRIRPSSFDAIAAPGPVDFRDIDRLRAQLDDLVFIEIKTANQDRVKPGFGGFFFALTESEISAAEALGSRHRVALFNNRTGEVLLTSVPEILARSRSTNWQVSVQL